MMAGVDAPTLLTGRVVTPGGVVDDGAVLLEGDRIAWVGPRSEVRSHPFLERARGISTGHDEENSGDFRGQEADLQWEPRLEVARDRVDAPLPWR